MRKRIKKEHVNFRFNVLIIIVYIIGIILITKLFDLQIVNGAEYRETSNTRLSRESTLEAARGEIMDRSGNVLASTYNGLYGSFGGYATTVNTILVTYSPTCARPNLFHFFMIFDIDTG